MLTKEDCFSDKWNPQSSAIDLNDMHLRDAVYYGMQLYAKEFLKSYLIEVEGCSETMSELLAEDYLQVVNQKNNEQ